MSRGRKPKSSKNGVETKDLVKLKIGWYLQLICTEMNNTQIAATENADDLLNKIKTIRQKNLQEKKPKELKALLTPLVDEIPFQIPRNWSWCRIGQIAEHNSGKTLDGGRNRGQPRNCITTSNLQWGRFELDTVKQILIDDNELNRCTATTGDLLICEGGEAGRAAIWDYSYDICFQNHIHRLRPFENINSKFIYFYFCYLSQSGEINKYRKGMGISNLSSKSLASIPFPLPPLSLQNKIASFLDDFQNNKLKENQVYFNHDIEKKVLNLHKAQLSGNELNNELSYQLSLVKNLRQQLLQDAVQGKLVAQDKNDEPASELLEKIKAEKDTLIKAGKLKKDKTTKFSQKIEKSSDLPSSWSLVKMGEVGFVTKLAGFEYTEYIKLKNEGEVPVIRAQNVKPSGIKKDELKYIDLKVSKILERSALTKDAILITFIGAGIGETVIFDEQERWHLAPNVAKFEPHGGKKYIELKYVQYLLRSPYGQKQIFKHLKQTAQPSLSMETIRDIDLILPPLDVQKKIVQKLDMILSCCDALEQTAYANQQHNKNLLQQVLSEALQTHNSNFKIT